MAIKINGDTVIDNNKKGGFSAVNPGVYTTATAPASPELGDIIYNSEEESLQVWDGTEWAAAGGASVNGPSAGNGSIVGPVITSPVKNGFVDNPYSITLDAGYSAGAADPYEKTVVLISSNEEFTNIIFSAISTDPTETEWTVTTPVTASQQLWARVAFYSTSGNRSEFGVKFQGVTNPTALQPC